MKRTIAAAAALASAAGRRPALVLSLAVGLGCALTLPFLYGLLPPDGVDALGIQYWAVGLIECMANEGGWLGCPTASLPGGYRPGFGLPFAVLAARSMRLFGISALAAYESVGALYLLLGLAGTALVGRRLGLGWPLALAAGWLFLSLPITFGKADYAFLMWGFVVAPLSLAADLWLLDENGPVAAAAAVTAAKLFALFSEPYSFVITSVFSVLAALAFTGRALRRRRLGQLWRPLWLALSLALAYGAYVLYLPAAASYPVMDLDFFRGQGIDLIAFFARREGLQLLTLPLYPAGLRGTDYFTDGEMVLHSFIGLSLLLAPIGGLLVARGRTWRHGALFASAIVCLLVSLGPALKIDDRRPAAGPLGRQLSSSDYHMPRELAALDFPWAEWFVELPGVRVMRAVSRWHLMYQLAASLFAMLLLDGLRRRRLALALAFGALLAAEHWPDLEASYTGQLRRGRHWQRFTTQAAAELPGLVGAGETVLFIQPLSAPEYLSIFLSARARCATYNAPTDKGLLLARGQWPEEIGSVAKSPTPRNLAAAFAATELDAAVVPFFDLRWNSYGWPLDAAPDAARQELARRLAGPGTEATWGRWFAVLRPAVPARQVEDRIGPR